MTELLDRQMAAFDRGAGLSVCQTGGLSPLDLLCRLDRRTVRTPALELISQRVAHALDTPGSRLIVVLPPQEGKSSTITRAGSLYALQQDPTRRIVITSYADRIAHRFGRMVRNDVVNHQGRNGGWDCGLRLAPDQRSKIEWELTTGGGAYSVGIGGALTSRSAEVMLIDDPLKGRKAADSQTVRDDAWDWWESTASSRLSPGARVLVPLTRWHYDDIVGRFLDLFPDDWDVLHIPAQADPEIVDPDPLGRRHGEFMVSARGRTQADWEQRKRDAGDEWEALYQGNPQAPSGSVFDMGRLRYWHLSRDGSQIVCGPRTWAWRNDLWRFITMDTADSTKPSADWTVASCWGIPPDGSLILLDVARARVPEHQQIDVARPLKERWAPETVYVEASMRGTTLVREAVQDGWHIEDLHADKSKPLRAAPFAKRVGQGRVWLPAEHELLKAVQKELKQFPNSRHDDFVDTGGYAARIQHTDWIEPSAPPPPPPRDPELERLRAATDVPAGFDPSRAQW